MRIGVDARPLSVGRGGIAKGLENLLAELLRIDRQNEYYLYSHRDFKQRFQGDNWRKRIGSRWLFLPGTLWLQTEGRRMMIEDKLDLLWGFAHLLPLRLPAAIHRLVTVHDLTWHFYPATMKFHNRAFHFLFFRPSLREADVIITDSESTARDLGAVMRVDRSRIRIIPLGAASEYRPHDPSAAANYIASKFQVSNRYLSAVGTIEPRKNLTTLIEAIADLRGQGILRHQLLVAGAAGWKNSTLDSAIRRHGLTAEEITFLGYIPDEDMPLLYSGSELFVFPSLYEGFGLPLVEAMACGVPVIASNTSSVAEIVGDAGILVSPRDARGLAEAISRLIHDAELRRDLRERGLRRVQRFRWDEAARKILRLFSETKLPGRRDYRDARPIPVAGQSDRATL